MSGFVSPEPTGKRRVCWHGSPPVRWVFFFLHKDVFKSVIRAEE